MSCLYASLLRTHCPGATRSCSLSKQCHPVSLPRSLFDSKETYSHREEMHFCADEDPRLCELESARSDLFGIWIPQVNSFDMSDVVLEVKLSGKGRL